MIFHGIVHTPHKVSCKELDDISPLSDVTRRVISMSNYNGFGCINFKFSANGFTQDVLDEHLREMRKLREGEPDGITTDFGPENVSYDSEGYESLPRFFDFNARVRSV